MANKKQKIKQLTITALILFIAIGMGTTIGIITWVIQTSPNVADYGHWQTSEATIVYDSNGDVLTKLYQENRIYVPISKIPKHLQNAVVSIEDARFWEHHGIDPIGIMRAIYVDLKHMAKVQGASTITQQLAKNALLTHKKTFTRKFQEMYIALQFERMYTKKEILEFYLNEIFLGYNAYGVQSAANYYFNKDVQDLTLAESALIAGLIKAPNYYSPYQNKKAARHRRNVVLNQMLEYGYITAKQARKAKAQPINLERPTDDTDENAPYFVRYVRNKLIDKFGAKQVYNGGLRVYTTLDPSMQAKAKATVDKAIKTGYIPTVNKKAGLGKRQPQLALVTIEPSSGHIKALIGGRGHDKFNRAIQANRQPGSAFKPFVYATAMKEGMSPGSVIDDTLKEYKTGLETEKTWIPENYNDKYLGPTTLRIGLAKSINVMAVKLLDKVGVNDTITTAKGLGIKSLVPQDQNLAIALGGLTKGVTPLEMAEAYGVFANQGIKVKPIAITKVYDSYGNIIWNHEAQKEAQKSLALDKSIAYLVTDMLQSAVARGPLVWGTGWRAKLNRPMAGKTGTTSNYSDAWFVGYTPDLVTSIWIGEDEPTRMEYVKKNKAGKPIMKNGKPVTEIISSGEAAALWGNYMEKVVKNKAIKSFKRPDNIITKEICIDSGMLPNKYCRKNNQVREELFIKGTEPTTKGTLHKKTATIKIDTSTGLIATENCPDDKIKEVKYQIKTNIIVDENGVPIKKYKPDTKLPLPLKDKEGNYIYKKIPQKKCTKHKPTAEDKSTSIKDKIYNFFNLLRGN
ncbi:penicillin-binding protein, 1A family [Halobacteroides halobius DSM 5150]|uniref:Penicillin-binding protein 1A n=1 Tax=Halobacteroides halobius (strain ATCC 35273 / DSM 5150 / MD-1) TaxID=748449 RepID=L0KAD0_HALHC|nr:PBP1A family penicillin-binding protein [Halobacteroides halobius]AGB41966.1 penicillin-binding protein, 1A family [Halobacteroides halobius DSM 5150]